MAEVKDPFPTLRIILEHNKDTCECVFRKFSHDVILYRIRLYSVSSKSSQKTGTNSFAVIKILNTKDFDREQLATYHDHLEQKESEEMARVYASLQHLCQNIPQIEKLGCDMSLIDHFLVNFVLNTSLVAPVYTIDVDTWTITSDKGQCSLITLDQEVDFI